MLNVKNGIDWILIKNLKKYKLIITKFSSIDTHSINIKRVFFSKLYIIYNTLIHIYAVHMHMCLVFVVLNCHCLSHILRLSLEYTWKLNLPYFCWERTVRNDPVLCSVSTALHCTGSKLFTIKHNLYFISLFRILLYKLQYSGKSMAHGDIIFQTREKLKTRIFVEKIIFKKKRKQFLSWKLSQYLIVIS